MRETPAVQPDDPTGPSLEKELAEEQRRRGQAGGGTGDTGDSASSACDVISCDTPSCDLPDCDLPGCDGCDGCDGCNLLVLVRLSSLLLVAAAVMPETGGRVLVRALLRAYRRWLTRFTPACPSTPSCSAYALAAVETRGARVGLIATAHRIRRCGGSLGVHARDGAGGAASNRPTRST